MSDHQQLMSMIAAFGLRAEARDWDAAQAAFADEVFVDYSSLFGGSGQTIASAALMNNWRALLPGFTRTQHTIDIALIVIEGSSARASAPFIAHHFIEDAAPAAGGDLLVGPQDRDPSRLRDPRRHGCAGLPLPSPEGRAGPASTRSA